MEPQIINQNPAHNPVSIHYPAPSQSEVSGTGVSTSKPFIEANTIEGELEEIKQRHIIPVYVKDNETAISHYDFIEATQGLVQELYRGEMILKPNIRLSHPIKGRIPSAKDKPDSQLLEEEKTLYYERMAFVIEIPSIYDEIDGNRLSLIVGGVKAYNLDNLYSKKLAAERFKVFIGFKNTVCTNLCIWTDGYRGDLRVSNLGSLKVSIRALIENYNLNFQLFHLNQLASHYLTESQFAHLIGRCRMYTYLPPDQKTLIPPMLFGENQIGTICGEYFRDEDFSVARDGTISLWKLYNLFTGANKSTYIDSFLDRSVNAFDLAEGIRLALEQKATSWFMN
jgi:Domain of unknown function, B. Theta Gene description (DUF3871)